MIAFNVGSLMSKHQGTRELFDVDEPLEFEAPGNPKLLQNVKFHLSLLKLPHEINANVTDLHTAVTATCSRCLKSFCCPIDVKSAEREFIIDLPKDAVDPGEDVYYINNRNRIVLDEMIRQEIILHFPVTAVCSEGCKGLCRECGEDLNMAGCKHAII